MFERFKRFRKARSVPRGEAYESPLTQRLEQMLLAAKGGGAYRMALKNEVLLYYVFDYGEAIPIGVYLYWPECTFVMEARFSRAEVGRFNAAHFERIFDECARELNRKHQAGELQYTKAFPWEFYELDGHAALECAAGASPAGRKSGKDELAS